MELRELTDEAIDYIYANLDTDKLKDPWEIDFIENTSDRWSRQRSLTDLQKIHLGKIWDKQS